MINFRSMIVHVKNTYTFVDKALTAMQNHAAMTTQIASLGFAQQPVLSICSGIGWGSALFYWSLFNCYAQLEQLHAPSDFNLVELNQQILKACFQYGLMCGGLGFFSTCTLFGGYAIRTRRANEIAEIENTVRQLR